MTRQEWIEARDRAREAYLEKRGTFGIFVPNTWSGYADNARQYAVSVDAAIGAALGPCPEPEEPAALEMDDGDGAGLVVRATGLTYIAAICTDDGAVGLDRDALERLRSKCDELLAWDDERRADQ